MDEKKKITDEELEAIIADYRNELRELRETRKRNSERYEAMTEEELIETIARETQEVYDHATGKNKDK